ncbi:MAG: DUF362 domain-containing protein, partial [Oscillospiraceae bacterium]
MCKVIIKQTDSYDPMTVYTSVKEIMLQQRINNIVNENIKVLLKPNMLSRQTPDKAVTTNPAVLDSVIAVLKEFGVKAENMLIADSSGGPSNSSILQGNYNTCGFSLIAENQNVPLYTKLKSRVVKTDGVMVKEFEVIQPVFDSDVIINLGKFKTHVMTGMSGAVKNLFGVIPGLKKAEFHMRFPDKDNFANMLIDLCQVVKPTFTIIDGIEGMEGDGPSGGTVRKLGFLMAGTNPYLIDLAICHMMGFEAREVPVMRCAIKRDLVPKEMPEGTVIGDVWLYKKIDNFVLPSSYSLDFKERLPRAISWATPAIEKMIAPRPKIIKNLCVGCGRCRDICPQKVITIKDGKANIELVNCIRCF